MTTKKNVATKLVNALGRKVFNATTNKAINVGANRLMELIGLKEESASKKTLPHELQAIIDADAQDYSLNLLSGQQFYKDKPITDLVLTRLQNELSATHNARFAEGAIKKAVQVACASNQFNPVVRYLDGLPAHDGVDRIPQLFDLMHIKTDDEAHRTLIEHALLAFLIACVARVKEPGCQCDSMLVLKGATGLRKSTWLRLLAVDRNWFSSALLDISKKDGLQIVGKFWLFEVAEFHAFLRKPPNAAKEFLSRLTDTYRTPFAKVPEDHPRRVVFLGSTNQERFISDPLSTRRFWPIEITDTIDTDRFLTIRDLLWSQAVDAYCKGQNWWLSSDDEKAMALKAARYQIG